MFVVSPGGYNDFIISGWRHCQSNQNVHKRSVGGRTQREGGSLPLHTRGVHRQVTAQPLEVGPRSDLLCCSSESGIEDGSS